MTIVVPVAAASTPIDISFIAAISVLAQLTIAAIIVGTVVWWLVPSARPALTPPASTLRRYGVWIAWGVAAFSMAASLWLSEHHGFDPCHLCDLQRFFMYPLVLILPAVALLRARWVTLLALIYPLSGLFWSIRHVYIEVNPSAESQTCRIGISCSFKWVDEFGYITIPLMAGTAFLLIIVLLGLAASAQPWRGSPSDPV